MTETTTHDESVEQAEDAPAKGRFKASYAAITLGILFALITVGSGILATITQWHDDSPVTREVFGGVPERVEGRVLHRRSGPDRLRRGVVLVSRQELGAGQARQSGDHQDERQAPARRLPGRRLHADAAA